MSVNKPSRISVFTEPFQGAVESASNGASLPAIAPIEKTTPRAQLSELNTTHPLMRKAVEAARGWAERKRSGVGNASLVLCGPVGTGKTHIARAILWSIVYTVDGQIIAPTGKFWHAVDMLMMFNPVRNDWGGYEVAYSGSLLGNASLVVLDDVGAEQAIPFVTAADQAAERASRYFRMIDYCYTRGISVIITSNLAPDALAQHTGRRVWDRLQEMAPRGYIVDLAGLPSYRVKAGGR